MTDTTHRPDPDSADPARNPPANAIPLAPGPEHGSEADDAPDDDGRDADGAPEAVNSEQEDAPDQAQTFAEAAMVRDTAVDGLSDSEKVSSGEDGDDVQDLVDHMNQMQRGGVIDMDAYRGERNDDDEEGSLGPDGARD